MKETIQLVREKYIKGAWIAFGVFWVLSLICYIALLQRPELAEMLQLFFFEQLGGEEFEQNKTDLFIFLLINNLRIAFITVLIGILPLFLSYLPVIVTSASVGAVFAVMQVVGLDVFSLFVFGILPHGIVEIFALSLSVSIGIRFSVQIIKKIGKPETVKLKEELKHGFKVFFFVVAPLIIVAAGLEAILTPYLLETYVEF